MAFTRFPARFGRYILLDRLNRGGMAEVFRAKTLGTDGFQRMLAVKCMLEQYARDDEFTSMFVDEAKLAAQLAHPNIAQIYELGRIDGQLYIAMELVNGSDLRGILRRTRSQGTSLGLELAAYLVHRVAEALDYAHKMTGTDGRPLRLVHRDVSPQNVLLSYDGEVKVVDFGIAKAEFRRTETRAGTLKGKFAYMAPEQLLGGAIDARADIFALGSVLFEAVTGSKLFSGESDLSVMERVREAALPADFEARLSGMPRGIGDVIRYAVQKDPAARFQQASEFAEALQPFLISGRNIYGPKHASERMRALFADAIEANSAVLRQFASVVLAPVEEPNAGQAGPGAPPDWTIATQHSVRAIEPVSPRMTNTATSEAVTQGSAPALELSDATQLVDMSRRSLELMANRQGGVGQATVALKVDPHDGGAAASHAARRRGAWPWFAAIGLATVAVVAALVLTRPKAGAEATENPAEGAMAQRPEQAPPMATPTSSPVPSSATAPISAGNDGNGASRAATRPRRGGGSSSGESKGRAHARVAQPDEDAEAEETGRFGFVTVNSTGAPTAVVHIDGREVGYAPVVGLRLKLGLRRVRVVDEVSGRAKMVELQVHARHTEEEPLVVTVTF